MTDLKPSSRSIRLPLSWAQEGYWAHHHASRYWQNGALHLSSSWALDGSPSAEAVTAAITRMVAATDGMRVTFSHPEDGAYQELHAPGQLNHVEVVPNEEFEAEFARVAAEPYEIHSEFSYRFVLGQAEGGIKQLGLAGHHLLFDQDGLTAVRLHLEADLRGKDIPPSVGLTGQLELESNADVSRRISYWNRVLNGMPNTVFADTRPGEANAGRGRQAVLVSAVAGRAVAQLSRDLGVPRSAVVLAGAAHAVGVLTQAPVASFHLIAKNRSARTRHSILNLATAILSEPIPTNVSLSDAVAGASRATLAALRHGVLPGAVTPSLYDQVAESRNVKLPSELAFNFFEVNEGLFPPDARPIEVRPFPNEATTPKISILCGSVADGTLIKLRAACTNYSDEELERALRAFELFLTGHDTSRSPQKPDLQWLAGRSAWISRARIREVLMEFDGTAGVRFVDEWAPQCEALRVIVEGDGTASAPTMEALTLRARSDYSFVVPDDITMEGFLPSAERAAEPSVDPRVLSQIKKILPDLDLGRTFFAQGGNLLSAAQLVVALHAAGCADADIADLESGETMLEVAARFSGGLFSR